MQGILVRADRAPDREAAKFEAEVKEFRRRRPVKGSFGRSALLILDMQEYFLRSDSHAFVPGAPHILPRLKKLQNRFLAAGRPVIQTRHLNQPGRAGAMESWWRDLIRKDDPRSVITPELADPRVKIVLKSRYDAFYRTRLESRLRTDGIRRLVIAGLVTHLCVETTIRAAFVRDFECVLPLDGTATWDDAFYRGSVRNLCHGFAVPAWIDEIIRELPE